MKKIVLFLLLVASHFLAKSQSNFIGLWEGKVAMGIDMRVIFTIKQDDAKKFMVNMDFPDQGLTGFMSKDVVINKDSIFINIKEMNSAYAGRQLNDSTISGEWRQGMKLSLTLKKIEKIKYIQRRQTPVPPFDYSVEDVTYKSKDKKIQFGATVTIPGGIGPFPAVVLITGSGQQNRDEEIAGHKPFAVIADELSRNGFLVLRADDRGVGKSTGDASKATTLDFSTDISAGLDYLKTRKDVDKKRLALIGHSEGGMIAEILAATRNDIAAIVLMAGPGTSGAEVLIEQNRAMFTSAGMSKQYTSAYLDLYTALVQHSKTDTSMVKEKVTADVENWVKNTPRDIVAVTTGIINDQKKIEFIDNFSMILSSGWFRYFLNFQPAQYLEKINCKVLALNGSKDVQVISQSNLAAIEAALKKSKTKGYQVKEYPGLNHLFQKCKICNVAEYGMLEETISTEVLADITAWLTRAM